MLHGLPCCPLVSHEPHLYFARVAGLVHFIYKIKIKDVHFKENKVRCRSSDILDPTKSF